MTSAMLISMGQRLKQVAQEAQTQMISLSRISSPAPNCSFLMISEGEDDEEAATGHPFVHFLHCRQALMCDSRYRLDLIDDSPAGGRSFDFYWHRITLDDLVKSKFSPPPAGGDEGEGE